MADEIGFICQGFDASLHQINDEEEGEMMMMMRAMLMHTRRAYTMDRPKNRSTAVM